MQVFCFLSSRETISRPVRDLVLSKSLRRENITFAMKRIVGGMHWAPRLAAAWGHNRHLLGCAGDCAPGLVGGKRYKLGLSGACRVR